MRKLKQLKVKLTSILYGDFKPANFEQVIIKAGGFNKINAFEVTKFDEIEGIIECIVYRANKTDSQGDFIENEELEKACEWNLDYLIKQGKNSPSDTNHNFEIAENVYLMQTFIDKSEPDWVWRQKINIKGNAELMKQAKAKTITGVSLAGEAQIETEEKGMLDKFMKWVESKITKAETLDNYNKEEPGRNIYKAWNAFYTAVIAWDEIKGGEYVKVSSEDYQKNVDDLMVILKSINISKGVDMKKELEDFLKTDAGIQELKTLGFEKKETSEEPKAEPETKAAEPETQTAPETIAKAEYDVIKAELDIAKSETEDLKKQLETIKTEFEDLKKAKQSDPTDTTTVKTLDDYIAEKRAKLMEKYQEKK